MLILMIPEHTMLILIHANSLFIQNKYLSSFVHRLCEWDLDCIVWIIKLLVKLYLGSVVHNHGGFQGSNL